MKTVEQTAMIANWILTVLTSTAATTVLIVSLAFLLRNLITNRLSRAVAHEYDARLEDLRLQNEQVLEAVREARAERESFRGLALSTLAAFQTATLERRVDAVETLWNALLETHRAVPSYVFLVDLLGYDKANFGPQLHTALHRANLIEALKPLTAQNDRVGKVRPFLSERLFALFSASQAALGLATSTTISSYQDGELRLWYKEAEAQDLLLTVLDEEELRLFESRGDKRLYWLYLQIQGKILAEIELLLSGRVTAGDSVADAHRILEAALAAAAGTSTE